MSKAELSKESCGNYCLVLTSENGTRYKLCIDNDGNLTTEGC